MTVVTKSHDPLGKKVHSAFYKCPCKGAMRRFSQVPNTNSIALETPRPYPCGLLPSLSSLHACAYLDFEIKISI